MSNPLESEREALLARMEVSRSAYRSRYVKAQEPMAMAEEFRTFPRSRTFRFIARHPYASIGLAAALVLVSPKPLGRALKGGAALTAGILGSSARTMIMRQVLPSVLNTLGSRGRRHG